MFKLKTEYNPQVNPTYSESRQSKVEIMDTKKSVLSSFGPSMKDE